MSASLPAVSDTQVRSGARRIMARLDALARLSAEPGALTRLYLTAEHKAAALTVRAWMAEAGMAAEIDAAGSVVGRYAAADGGATLILGSHIDTVRNAGKYDGIYGVVAAIEAVATLHAAGERLPCAIEVVAFGDEEGVRFPVTLTGSRAIAGALDPAALDVTDAGGMSLREALQRFGCDPAAIAAVARSRARVAGYVEVHIEQGPVLEDAALPVGIVTAIAGATRATITIDGIAGHSGTVPMRLRHDALAAAAEMVLAVERIGVSTPDLVATVGQIAALPGATNVIPGQARFTIDVRSPADPVREQARRAIEAACRAIAERRGVGCTIQPGFVAGAAVCAPFLIEQIEAAVARAGVRPLRLPSGAGHDGLAMAGLCPIGMLFVRCKGGVSHNPAESITEADVAVAQAVLLDFLRRFRPETPP